MNALIALSAVFADGLILAGLAAGIVSAFVIADALLGTGRPLRLVVAVGAGLLAVVVLLFWAALPPGVVLW